MKDLQAELERIFGNVTLLRQSPCAYRTSFELQELDIRLDDGAELRLMLKSLSRSALSGEALAAKPEFLYDALREIETYRTLLGPAEMGTPAFYGATVDPPMDRFWLFIENVEGDALWQVGEPETWQAAARWLAAMHVRFEEADLGSAAAHLVPYDERFYALWMERLLGFARSPETDWDAQARESIEWLAERYGPVVERLSSFPRTFIHGEFYPSNVLIQGSGPDCRVSPIDWEVAAVGPGLVDLAALTIGRWTDEERDALALAYHSAHHSEAGRGTLAELHESLTLFRLHLAVQWLGWEPSWSPPKEHRQDWLGTALTAARELGL